MLPALAFCCRGTRCVRPLLALLLPAASQEVVRHTPYGVRDSAYRIGDPTERSLAAAGRQGVWGNRTTRTALGTGRATPDAGVSLATLAALVGSLTIPTR